MIVFDHVTKQFGSSTPALSDISITIPDGQFVFLIGPSGAGKSTLLRLMLRDVPLTSGSIVIDEWDIGSIPDASIHLLRRHIGMVFQDFKLLTDRTIYENVALGLEILGKQPEEIEKGVMDVLSLVGLPDKRLSFPLQLSAGELQRVGIARAIVGGPKILLADEPTGNLDPNTAEDIMDILQEINKLGTTVVVATHNVAVVNQMKKRTITIKQGVITTDEEKGKYHIHPRHHHETHRGKEDE
jgi:cell division transport system ATP-binding protein